MSKIYDGCEDAYYDVHGELLGHIEQFAFWEREEQTEAGRQAAALKRKIIK